MERARREEEARLEEQQRRREEEARERSEYGLDEQFDPYAILGLPPDASRDSIDSAYEEARTKYDAEQVSHLSAEVQEHYKLKAQAVERAYQMLTAPV
jgi:preprotein translocase subunit Sec63